MATYTIYAATANDGHLRSNAAGYSNARAGSGTITLTNDSCTAGHFRSGDYYVYESFISFDTSSVVGTISSAVLSLYHTTMSQDNDAYTVQARLNDYGSTLETGDWVAGTSLSSKTLLASIDSPDITINAYNDYVDVALAANINQSGSTRFIVHSSDTISAPALGNNESQRSSFQGASAANPPKLVITTSDPTGNVSITLGAVTSSATGTLEISGAATATLSDLALSSTATLTGTQEGVLNTSLDALTLSSTVAIETFGYAENTLGDVTLSTVALVDLDGELTATLGALTSESVIARNFEGALTATLGALTLQSTNISGVTASLTATLGALTLQAVESGPPWPVSYDFPQAPLDGTWRRERGDDTLRSGGEVGAREYRARSGGNYADVTFAIMVKSKTALDLLDRFYRDDCKNGATPFYWIDPETGDNMAWLWAAPPQIRHVARETYRVECALLKEAA